MMIVKNQSINQCGEMDWKKKRRGRRWSSCCWVLREKKNEFGIKMKLFKG
jgi:hypothetical protein